MARGPHVWFLHLGYAQEAVRLLRRGAQIADDMLSTTAELHAITAGAFGSLPQAIMSRATSEHPGRPLSANRITTLVYLSVTDAALLRVLSPTLGELSASAPNLSATLQVIALAGFAVIYAPMFFGHCSDGTVF